MSIAETPAHIAELLGKTVRVTGPHGEWEGRLSAYASDPSVIIDGPGGRMCLPAAFGIERIPDSEAAGDGAGSLTRHVPVRFDRETVAQIREFSDEDGMTVSAWVRKIVSDEVRRRGSTVTVSRADLELVLACTGDLAEHVNAARNRLLDIVDPA